MKKSKFKKKNLGILALESKASSAKEKKMIKGGIRREMWYNDDN